MKKRKSFLDSNVLYTAIAIVIGFVIGAIFLAAAGISPVEAYGKLIDGVFGKPKFMIWTLVYAAPLIFTGLSVAFSLRYHLQTSTSHSRNRMYPCSSRCRFSVVLSGRTFESKTRNS